MEETVITIEPPFIKLEALLKFAGLTGTGGEAKVRIQEGEATGSAWGRRPSSLRKHEDRPGGAAEFSQLRGRRL